MQINAGGREGTGHNGQGGRLHEGVVMAVLHSKENISLFYKNKSYCCDQVEILLLTFMGRKLKKKIKAKLAASKMEPQLHKFEGRFLEAEKGRVMSLLSRYCCLMLSRKRTLSSWNSFC